MYFYIVYGGGRRRYGGTERNSQKNGTHNPREKLGMSMFISAGPITALV